jgi:ADP-ribosylglycohydrolase
MFITSLIADSLALGPHWMYDRKEIAARFPHMDSLFAPATSYHPSKQAGDQTHLGESLLATDGVHDSAHFMNHWRTFWLSPETKSYRDKATKHVLENGTPAPSTELGGLARTGALAQILLIRGVRDYALAEALYSNVRLTHDSDSSQRVTAEVADLLTQIVDGRDWIAQLPNDPWPALSAGEAIERIGQSCDAAAAWPAVQLLLRRFASDPAQALRENTLAGGDSAARGLVLGMALGAAGAVLPSAWQDGLHAAQLAQRVSALR